MADKDALKKALLERAKREKTKRETTIGDRIKSAGTFAKDFVMGDGDPNTESPGERAGFKAATLLNMGGEALTLGLVGDEAATKFDEMTGRAPRNYRAAEERLRQENPIMSFGAEVAPAFLLPAAGMMQKGGLLARALKGAAGAGAAGATYGFMEGEGGLGPRLENARNVGLLSGVLGGAAPYMTRGIERVLDRRAANALKRTAIKNAPTDAQLSEIAAPIFQRADQANIPRAGLAQMADDTARQISNRPINPKLMPKTAALMDDLTDVATDPNPTVQFGELNDIRKMTAAARGDFTNPVEQRGGGIIASAIDDFVDGVDPALSKDITKAREMWSRLRKNEAIEEVVARAANQASGFENGLRIGIRQILNNKKKRAGFSKAEIEAMEQIVQGTTFGNLMKKLGKLGFGRGQQTNVLSGTAGTAVFGPASLLAGQAALAGSEALTARSVGQLQNLIRAGGVPSTPSVAQVAPQLPGLLNEALMRSAPRVAEYQMAR